MWILFVYISHKQNVVYENQLWIQINKTIVKETLKKDLIKKSLLLDWKSSLHNVFFAFVFRVFAN